MVGPRYGTFWRYDCRVISSTQIFLYFYWKKKEKKTFLPNVKASHSASFPLADAEKYFVVIVLTKTRRNADHHGAARRRDVRLEIFCEPTLLTPPRRAAATDDCDRGDDDDDGYDDNDDNDNTTIPRRGRHGNTAARRLLRRTEYIHVIRTRDTYA